MKQFYIISCYINMNTLSFKQFRSKEYMYKKIFFLSTLCILLQEKRCHFTIKKNVIRQNLHKVINVKITVTISALLICNFTSSMYHCKEYFMKEIFFPVSIFAVYTSSRIHVQNCINKLHVFKKNVSRVPLISKKQFYVPLWTIIWSYLIIIFNFSFFIFIVKRMLTTDTFKALFYNYQPDNTFLRFIAYCIYSYVNAFIMYMPLNIFAITYVMICLEIKELILNFYSAMKNSQRTFSKNDQIVFRTSQNM